MRFVVLIIAALVGAISGHLTARSTAPAPAHLGARTIETSPPGAFVYVDGQLMVGDDGSPVRTPVRLENLPADSEAVVRVVLDGHRSIEEPIRADGTTLVLELGKNAP